MFLNAKHTDDEHEILVLVLSWSEESHRQRFLAESVSREQGAARALHCSLPLCLSNKTGGQLGLSHGESPVLSTPSFPSNCSSVINSSRTDEIQWCVNSESSFYDYKKNPVKTTTHLFHHLHSPVMGASAIHWESLSTVYWQLYLVSITLAFHLTKWNQ